MTNTLEHHANTEPATKEDMDQSYLETGCVVSPYGEHDESPELGKCLNCDLPTP